jgi:excisionase family DNA binding protein
MVKTQNAQIALSVADAMKLVPLSRPSFYAAIHRGEIPHIRVGKRILIPRKSLERWAEETGLRSVAGGVR